MALAPRRHMVQQNKTFRKDAWKNQASYFLEEVAFELSLERWIIFILSLSQPCWTIA